MDESRGIRVDEDAFAPDVLAGGEVPIEFVPDRAVEPAFFDAMASALEAANEEAGEFGAGLLPTVVGALTVLKYAPSEQELRDWLVLFVTRLGRVFKAELTGDVAGHGLIAAACRRMCISEVSGR